MTDRSVDVVPFAFTAPLSVCVDVKSPAAYLALAPVRALGDELGVAVDWLPFPTAPVRPPPEPADDRGTRHRRIRASYLEADLERYAAAQGLTIRAPYRDADSTLSLLALLWLRERAPGRCGDYLQQLFSGYWEERLDVGANAAICAVLEGVGQDPEAFIRFVAGPGPRGLAVLRERLVAAGVFTVPSLVVEGEVFVGRAHLPMVRWLLGGRSGPPPI
jgi:2-hydroxychromene-2-carboxylate isomerase